MKALVILLFATTAAWAHKPSDAHVQIVVNGDRIGGTLAVAVRDLDGALDLDANGDGNITWAEVRAAASRIDTYERARLTIEGCDLKLGSGSLVDFSDGAYWTVAIDGTCGSPRRALRVTYNLLFDIDAQHRGIVQIVSPHATETVVARSSKVIAVDLHVHAATTDALAGVTDAVAAPQHLLVLFLLLLPVAGRRLQTLAAFLAGALATTLVASTGILHLPGELTELCLAITGLIAAAANLVGTGDRFKLAFELGLVHGFGIALWAADLDAHPLAFGVGLLAALGVAGAILTRVRLPYPRALSAMGAALALVWVLQV